MLIHTQKHTPQLLIKYSKHAPKSQLTLIEFDWRVTKKNPGSNNSGKKRTEKTPYNGTCPGVWLVTTG